MRLKVWYHNHNFSSVLNNKCFIDERKCSQEPQPSQTVVLKQIKWLASSQFCVAQHKDQLGRVQLTVSLALSKKFVFIGRASADRIHIGY